jgi:hypothetical protein
MSPTPLRFNFPQIPDTNCYGIIDKIEIRQDVAILIGWVFNGDSADPVPVSVKNKQQIIGKKLADESRPDVLAAGAPTECVGFQIPLKTTGDETQITVHVCTPNGDRLFGHINIKEKLPRQALSRDDISSVFQLLFHRLPENEGAIIHQLEHHSGKLSLFSALFDSPEFYEKNSDLIKLLHETKFR